MLQTICFPASGSAPSAVNLLWDWKTLTFMKFHWVLKLTVWKRRLIGFVVPLMSSSLCLTRTQIVHRLDLRSVDGKNAAIVREGEVSLSESESVCQSVTHSSSEWVSVSRLWGRNLWAIADEQRTSGCFTLRQQFSLTAWPLRGELRLLTNAAGPWRTSESTWTTTTDRKKSSLLSLTILLNLWTTQPWIPEGTTHPWKSSRTTRPRASYHR